MIQALLWLNMRVKQVGTDGTLAQGCVREGWKRTKLLSGDLRLVVPEWRVSSVGVRVGVNV
jgi:hypothetical protein